MDYMVQHPTNTAVYPPKVLLLICLLDGKAYDLAAAQEQADMRNGCRTAQCNSAWHISRSHRIQTVLTSAT